MLPISRVPGQPPIALIDALFTSTSAVCVTGLTTLDTGSYFSRFGQVIILFLVQVGGLGLMTFVGLAYLVIGEKMSLHGKLTTQNAVNESNAANVGKFLVAILVTTFSIEFIGAIFLFISMQSRLPFGDAVYYSIFHAVSAFCNAGFRTFFPQSDVFPERLYRSDNDNDADYFRRHRIFCNVQPLSDVSRQSEKNDFAYEDGADTQFDSATRRSIGILYFRKGYDFKKI